MSVLKIVYLDIQGDPCDSSDEEWDRHIGGNARAFLGLNEPISEIALDGGVGIGMMVRNPFALADDIHMRAAVAATASSTDADSSPTRHQLDDHGVPDDVNNMNVCSEGEGIAEFQTRPMRSNYSYDESQDPGQHRGSSGDGSTSHEEGSARFSDECECFRLED